MFDIPLPIYFFTKEQNENKMKNRSKKTIYNKNNKRA